MVQTEKKIILSAIQPTNQITLGNYIGAIRNWVQLQSQFDCYFFAVDMHALTVRQNPQELRDNTLFAMATYLAAGIDPSRCVLFIQSQVPQHAELAWIMNCFAYMGELGRMTQYKDKSAKAGQNIPVGIFTYPLLMAADILLYDAQFVPVGADQKQHIEITRDIAQRVNAIYGEDTFVVPEPYIPKIGSRIMDLQDPTTKMSKSGSSEMGAVYITDNPKEIEKKIKRAVTDSGSEIAYSPEKAGVSNLLEIQSALTGRPIEKLVAAYQGKQYGHLKVDTATLVVEALRPIEARTRELLSDRAELIRLLERGADSARQHATRTLARLYDRIGFVRNSV
jgi:tryptophanyl-tRNA synthetase